MRVLIVEDEAKTGEYLRQGLHEAGYVTDLVRNGPDGLHLALTGDYDLLVLDVMLPGMDGWQILQTLRQTGKRFPVLFLTARDQVEDRVKGLELGQTIIWSSLLRFPSCSRVCAPCWRGRSGTEPTTLALADLELDLLRRRVTRAGKRIDLTAKEFALLELLLRRQGEVLPRSLIASQVWDMNFDSDTNVVEVAIRSCAARLTIRSRASCSRPCAAWAMSWKWARSHDAAPVAHHPAHDPVCHRRQHCAGDSGGDHDRPG
jgi:two-component system copper resistance phosphate regulon response regulator CusR